MAYDLKKFSAGCMDKGISIRTMDFQGELVLGGDTYNMSQGIQQGLGPRPGMSTIPGQADNETVSSSRLPGLRASQGNAAQGLAFRRRVLGIYPIRIVDPTQIGSYVSSYLWLLTRSTDEDSAAGETLEIAVSSTLSSSRENPSDSIYAGFGYTVYDIAPAAEDITYLEAIVPTAALTKKEVLRGYLAWRGSVSTPENNRYFCSSALFTVTGSNIPMQWTLGNATATGGATTAPSVNYLYTQLLYAALTTGNVTCGIPSEFNLQTFVTTPRALKIFALTNTGALNIAYSALVNPGSTNFKSVLNTGGNTNPNLDMSAITATKDTAGVTYSNTVAALVNDNECVTNSSYKAMLIANGSRGTNNGAYACIFQDAFRAASTTAHGKFNQWFDLTQNTWQPRSFASSYTEETVSTKTGFVYWPAFVRGTAMVTGTSSIGLTAATTGILRANTVYEFTYALYNKRLNFETNVAPGVKIQTGATDFVSLNLYTPSGAGATAHSDYEGGTVNAMFPIEGNWTDTTTGALAPSACLNHLEYRFYYRQEGTFEWLPALFVDAAQYWFYPGFTKLAACTGSLAASVGGQPGGFNDYSPLPNETYNCVVQYKDRAWWFSENAINFSLRRNIFCYPARNSVSATAGQFRGGIVHNYPGQAEQGSRLVIFGSTTTYVARFTGQPAQQAVQVSPDNSGIFDIDASDLVIDPWTSVTAFSYRAAVIAEGILYWWGQQGIFRDDGVNTPTRISQDLEPDLFSLFDPNKTAEILGSYNNQTKEIEWFFTPKTNAGDGEVNASIIYNTLSGNFTKGKYKQQVDWLQGLQVDTNVGTAGFREVLGTRVSAGTAATVKQRAYFFDQRNRAGDLAPTKDFVIKQVSTPATGQRRLTLAAGYDATNFATLAVGDYLALQQVTSYSGLASASDLIATIAAVSTGSGYIDINLPTGATLPTGSLTFDQYFPIWTRTPTAGGLNGIPYRLPTQYWIPGGINGYFFWLYVYLLAKMNQWVTDLSLGWTLGYRTPTATSSITDQIAFDNNSDGNFQVYHPLRPGNPLLGEGDNMEGQGLKLVLSGYHIGQEWVLQYLEAHATPIDGDALKRFEG